MNRAHRVPRAEDDVHPRWWAMPIGVALLAVLMLATMPWTSPSPQHDSRLPISLAPLPAAA